jgi:hypothetical protein
MKPYASLFLLAAFSCCVLSCDFPGGFGNSGKPNNNPGGPETGGERPIILARYQMEVVNNTGSAVSVFAGDFYYRFNNDYHALLISNYALCTVAGNTEGTAEFEWAPRMRLGGSDSCDPPDPSSPTPTMEEMKAQLHPGINSFFLKICIEGEECYLAGWPEFVNLPPLTEPDYFGFVLDTQCQQVKPFS